MPHKSTIKTNWPKHVLQWGVLAVLIFFFSGLYGVIFPKADAPDPEKYCPFGGLEALGTYLAGDTLPCSMTSVQIVMGIALAAAVVLFGKLFCAYLCPVGTVEDLLKKLRGAVGLNSIMIREFSLADRLLRAVKYGLLFMTFRITMMTSELFCKKFDPYYAAATGFQGEISLWPAVICVAAVLLLGLVIDRFWCKYICPLGAICSSLKFWPWVLLTVAAWWLLGVIGLNIPWIWLLGALCLAGYLLEILNGRPRMQLLGVMVNHSRCVSCHHCTKSCPYNIDVPSFNGKVTSVDCMLCGECIGSCPTDALTVGMVSTPQPKVARFTRFLPAIIAVVLLGTGFALSGRFEIPTIDVKWGVTQDMELETVTLEGLKSVKCYSSSMAFKARMESVRGVHGVKTFVGSHRVVVSYDPAVTTAEKVQEEAFVPSTFRVNSLEPTDYTELKRVTLRTEKMHDRMDLNYLGLQFRATGRRIYGIESVYDCPLVVYLYVAPDEEITEEFAREIVEKKVLEMPTHGGGVREIPVDFEFVRLEKGESQVPVAEYLEMMFDHFSAEYNGRYDDGNGGTVVRKRSEVYAGDPQWIYRITDRNYEKPIVKRGLPYLSNHLSKEEGVIGTYLRLDENLLPCLDVRFAAPMTADRLWELMTMDTWTITYSPDDVRQESARLNFSAPGRVLEYTTQRVPDSR